MCVCVCVCACVCVCVCVCVCSCVCVPRHLHGGRVPRGLRQGSETRHGDARHESRLLATRGLVRAEDLHPLLVVQLVADNHRVVADLEVVELRVLRGRKPPSGRARGGAKSGLLGKAASRNLLPSRNLLGRMGSSHRAGKGGRRDTGAGALLSSSLLFSPLLVSSRLFSSLLVSP